MVGVCFYFQVHQPFRLNKFTAFDIGTSKSYFDESKNREIIKRVSNKCYLPMNQVLLTHLKNETRFCCSFSISGMALEQLEMFSPDALHSFQELSDTGRVEFLSETHNHSLASLYSDQEFREQVRMHAKKIRNVFGQKPRVFRNT